MQRLERLEKLFLHSNPGLGLPDEVLGPTAHEVFDFPMRSPKPPREILDYYFATRGSKGRALREVKLIVVGRGGAGKTSLVKRLKGEPFDPHEGETHGINIRELELACEDGPVQARVWDFGGQHVLHAMHEFFLAARSLYLLVLGERDDMAERDAVYWLQLIRSYAGQAPVVVALNKSGGRAREMDRRTLEEKYGPIIAWIPTDCSDSDPVKSGIDALRVALTKTTDGMEEVRRRFPAKWFEIKKWLSGMEDSSFRPRLFRDSWFGRLVSSRTRSTGAVARCSATARPRQRSGRRRISAGSMRQSPARRRRATISQRCCARPSAPFSLNIKV